MGQPVFASSQRSGIVLISVLLVSAVGLSICLYLLLLAVSSARSVILQEQLAKAKANADACAESALDALHLSSTYTGSTTFTFSNGSCQILSVLGSGTTNRTIRAKGVSGDAVRRVEILVSQTTPQLLTTSWQEVADFSSP